MKTKLILILSIITQLNATVLHVPDEYSTIQEGINASVDGDTVLVAAGTYGENINFNGKNIVVTSSGAVEETIIDGNQNSSVVTFENDEDSTAVLDGFTLQNGSGKEFYIEGVDWDGNPYYYFIYLGGAIYSNGNPSLINLIIQYNNAEFGGGIYLEYAELIFIQNTIIRFNNAQIRGGGIYSTNLEVELVNSQIDQNTSIGGGGGIYLIASNFIINNSEITGNSGMSGGGVEIFASDITINNSLISNNQAISTGTPNGGGINCDILSHIELNEVIISGNIANNIGGGMIVHSASANLQNVIIFNNSSYTGAGLGLQWASEVNMINVTISDNIANSRAGAIFSTYSPAINLINSILWNNSPNEIEFNENFDDSELTISYTDIQGGLENIETNNAGEIIWLEANLIADPLFTDPENGDFTLTIDSPCIDAGDPDSPLDPDGTIADMGALYFDQEDCPGWELGDPNQDGEINVLDIVETVGCVLASCWYEDWCIPWAMDMNQDGSVNILDIVTMVYYILEG